MRYLSVLFFASTYFLSGCGDDGGGSSDDAVSGDGRVDGATGGDGGGGPDAAVVTCDPVSGTPELDLEMVQGGFSNPILVTHPPGDQRVFVVEQDGTVDIVGGGTFLDIQSTVQCCGEEGLLGLAFHRQYAANGRLFVYYINNSGHIQIDEFTASPPDADSVDVATRRQITNIQHVLVDGGNRGNHNGGMIAFGPDGMLYISTGDGGSGGDPDENGQDPDSLLGKILRIDIDGSGDGPFGNYDIPVGNPLGDEIWAVGLRNPWRFSFDRMTGDIYIGDVGQETIEEVNVAPNAMAGLNFGWDVYEGTACFEETVRDCADPPTADTAVVFPIATEPTGGGINPNRAIVGGYVYRGCRMPGYHGTYFYGTLNGIVRSLEWTGGTTAANERDWPSLAITAGGDRLSAFGEDHAGEVYVVAYDAGIVYKIVPVP